jgi:hypothetical protein
VGDRDAVDLTGLDKRWQLGLDCLGAEQPPCSQGTLCHVRLRLLAPNLDKILLERTVTLAEQTGRQSPRSAAGRPGLHAPDND